jgi:hypothetical protein
LLKQFKLYLRSLKVIKYLSVNFIQLIASPNIK